MATDASDPSDDAIDTALRGLAVPAAMAARASVAELFSDAALDRMLTAVVVPGGLVDRVRAGVADRPHGHRGVDLDHVSGVFSRGSSPAALAPPVHPRLASAWWRGVRRSMVLFVRDAAVVAAALVVMAGMFGVGMGLSEWLARTGEPKPGRQWPGSRDTAATPPVRPAAGGRDPQAVAAVDAGGSAGELQSLAPAGAPRPAAVPADGSGIVELRGPAHSLMVRGALDVNARDGGNDVGMRVVPSMPASRHRVPRERGFDLAFEIQHGESPFIDPSAGPTLVDDTPPLAVRTDSFDAVLEAIRSGRRPALGMVRAEHVVAAMSAPDPVAADAAGGRPVLSLHGVRSLRTAPQSVLVELAVTAPPLGRQDAAPIAATLILDRSAAGGTPPAWQSTCRGVAAVAALMRPADRVTVIVAASRPIRVVDRGDAAAVGEASRLLSAIPADGAADLDAAVRLAMADANARGRPSCVVVSSRDSLERSRAEAAAAFAAWQRESAGSESGVGEEPSAFVLVSAAAGNVPDDGPGTRGDVGRDSAAIRRGLIEAVFRRPAVVVRDCRVTVSMNPAVVASYRLVGHRHSAVESISQVDVPPVDLLAGETARAVYEVVLKTATTARSGGGQPDQPWMVRARLEGRLPGKQPGALVASQAVLVPTAIEPSSPLPSRRGCEIILATEAGELLAASIHAAPGRRDARAVAAFGRAWHDRGDVTPFGADVLACLERPRVGVRSNSAAFDGR